MADYGGGDWSPTGDIILGSGVFEGLQGLLRVSQAGGAPRPLTQIDATRKELSHQWPRLLADGKSVLFTIWYGAPETAELAIASLDEQLQHDPLCCSRDGEPLLHVAVRGGSAEVVRLIVASALCAGQIDARDRAQYNTALTLAVEIGAAGAVAYFFSIS